MPDGSDVAPMRVAIDARIASGQSGGVEGVIIGLAHGLSQLEGPDEYHFVVWPALADWLTPHIAGPCRLAPDVPIRRSAVARAAGKAGRAIGRIAPIGIRRDPDSLVPSRDPAVAALDPTVVHMPRQRGFLTSAPSIYHPHDLQHVHFPEFFTARERAFRERVYGRLCRQAAMVAVASDWTRRDVVNHYQLAAEKVRVVQLAPPLGAVREPTSEERLDVRRRFRLPAQFALYPAQTWPHKNHIRLLESLARCKAGLGYAIPLVCTGTLNDHFSEVSAAAARLGLEAEVTWTGFISEADLRAVYLESRMVVIPSLFEAASGPLWEAFLAGVPAACSTATSLPDQAGDAAVLFDPLDVKAMSEAVARVWADESLRQRLVVTGRERVAKLTWESTARHFRAHYRRLAGLALNEEDLALVAA